MDEHNENTNTEDGAIALHLLQLQWQKEKNKETADFKSLLTTLALSVIAVTVLVLFIMILYTLLSQEFITYSSRTSEYFFMWLENDIINYLFPILIFWLIFRKYLKYEKPGEPYEFKMWWVFPLFLALLALSTISNLLVMAIESVFTSIFGGDGLPDVFADVAPVNFAEFLIMLLMVGIIAPVCEEIIYRHLLLKPLRRYGDFLAVAVTSLLFGFFHANLTQFLYTTVGGFLLGIVAIKANSVKPAIFIHALNNIFDVIRAYIIDMSEVPDLAELSDSGEIPFSTGTVAVSMLSLLMLLLGVVVLIVILVKRKFRIENYNPYITASERVRILISRPSVIITTVLLCFMTIFFTVLISSS